MVLSFWLWGFAVGVSLGIVIERRRHDIKHYYTIIYTESYDAGGDSDGHINMEVIKANSAKEAVEFFVEFLESKNGRVLRYKVFAGKVGNIEVGMK